MTGYKHFNFPAFDDAKKKLLAAGYEVVSPADLDRQHGFDPIKHPNIKCSAKRRHAFLEHDKKILKTCDGMALLPGWEYSTGVAEEIKAFAPERGWMDRRILPLEYWLPAPETAESMLESAREIVNGDRQRDYGKPEDNHKCTELMYECWRHHNRIGPHIPKYGIQVCAFNIIQKLSRLAHTPNHTDSLKDIIGYVLNWQMILDAERKKENPK